MTDMEFPNVPQFIASYQSSILNSESWVMIDSSIAGMSCGGVRVLEDVTLEEIMALAKAMTKKYSFFGKRMGGGKAGIRLPQKASTEEKKKLLFEFGTRFKSIIQTSIYIPWTDMNCNQYDILHIYKGAGYNDIKFQDSSFSTALSAFHSIKAALRYANNDIKGKRVAIEGYGGVGRNIASLLSSVGARIVGFSTLEGAFFDPGGFSYSVLKDLNDKHSENLANHLPPSLRISREDLLTLEVDILIPCARPWSITNKNLGDIQAKIVVPVSNVPYEQEIEEILWRNGRILIPDFIANSGGIMSTNLLNSGILLNEIETNLYHPFEEMLLQLLIKSKRVGVGPSQIASKIAWERFQHSVNYEESLKERISKKVRSSLPFFHKKEAFKQMRVYQEQLRILINLIENF